MFGFRGAGRRVAVSVSIVAAVGLAGCSSDDDGGTAATAEPSEQPAATDPPATDGEPTVPSSTPGDVTTVAGGTEPPAPVECEGEPLRFTAIVRFTGPLTFPSVSTEIEQGTEAALHAVNSECRLGRPIEVVLCDDKSDPNEATRCGREAAADGSLALFINSGTFDTGTNAAALPGVMTGGASLFDLTNEQSFSAHSGLTLVVGGLSAAKAAGAENVLMVAVDTAASQAFVGLSQGIAENLGVQMDALYVPADTTDYAPIAAQVAERDADSISLILPSVVPFLNALESEGITAQDVPIMTAVSLMVPEVIDELGSTAEGMYLLSQTMPPSEQDNPGIQQMMTEFEAAGIDVDPNDLTPTSTSAWSSVHVIDDILATVPPETLDALDPAALAALMSQVGATERPEFATFDFTTNAYPDIESLAGLRLFSRDALVVQIRDGGYDVVSPFSDATQPFDIES